ATISPAPISRCTSRSTSRGVPSRSNSFETPRTWISASFMAEGVDRPELGGHRGGEDRGCDADEHGGEANEHEVAHLDVDGEMIDVEDLGRNADPKSFCSEGEKVAEPEPQERAHHADEEPLEDERV